MKTSVLIYLLCLLNWGYGQVDYRLIDLTNPVKIVIEKDRLYISDDYKIKIFDFKDLSLLKEIGRRGEGPGEFDRSPDICICDDKIFASTSTKVYWFNKDGELIQEIRLPFHTLKILSVRNKYVSLEFHYHMEVNLYDEHFNKIKTLYQEPGPDPNRLNPLQNNIDFDVTDSYVFIAEPEKGLVIEVFDFNGKSLFIIEKKYHKIKLQDWYKERIFESISKNPVSEEIKKKIVFPEYFPALSSFFIDDELLYIKTYEKEKDEFRFIVLDTKGNELKRIMLPEAISFTFKDGYYYWLVYDEKSGKYKICKKEVLIKVLDGINYGEY
ncbi:MAG: hypothetical protein KBI45_04390 [Candidatus Saccharicenans sp.]|jgi:hypothetical protein|nr:hypothetical protein [Candidatus Saccharicenans sp.]